INPGNSGGALINTRGEVVGINTAIFSESGGSQGIGFAIPVHIARTVVRQIAEHGRVIRGWIGISAQAMTPAITSSLGYRHHKGLLISAVLAGGPADLAGVRPGDLLFSIDGRPVGSAAEALDLIANRAPGDLLHLGIERDGQILELEARAAERPAPKG
ncbi:MAG: PDZ domain-containing protein, partial [Gammaproteobacteria bacterium]